MQVAQTGDRELVAGARLLVDRRPLVWQWYDRFLQLIETKNVNSKWI